MTTTARATLTVEISGLGAWGDDCKLNQVYDQARREALDKLEQIKYGGPHHGINIRVIDEPKITAILVDKE